MQVPPGFRFLSLFLFCLAPAYGQPLSYEMEKNGISVEMRGVLPLAQDSCAYQHVAYDQSFSLSEAYNLTVQGNNIEVKPHKSDPYRYLMIPHGENWQLMLTASSERDTLIFPSFSGCTQPPPPPLLSDFRLDHQSFAERDTVVVKEGSRLQFILKADSTFKADFPLEARYGASEIEMYTQDELGEPKLLKRYLRAKGADISLDFPSQYIHSRFEPQIIFLSFKGIQRMDRFEKLHPVTPGERIFFFFVKL